MSIEERIPGRQSRGVAQLISELDRKSAIRELTVFHQRGFIDDTDLELRVERVESAKTAQDIELLFVDLRDGRRGRGELRASDDERAAALRRLALHREAGQMSDEEYEQRTLLVGEATVPREISAAMTELPPLRPRRQSKGERLASDAERLEAEDRLNRECDAGRLDAQEHETRVEVVRAARTRNEIESAFSGLGSQRIEKPLEVATKVGSGIARGSILIAGVVLIFGWALFIAAVAIVWQVTGIGPIAPLFIMGIATFLLLVMLRTPRVSLGRRSRT
jgi:hypothetical protein